MKHSYEYELECAEIYKKGEMPKISEGVSENRFRHDVCEWTKLKNLSVQKV